MLSLFGGHPVGRYVVGGGDGGGDVMTCGGSDVFPVAEADV